MRLKSFMQPISRIRPLLELSTIVILLVLPYLTTLVVGAFSSPSRITSSSVNSIREAANRSIHTQHSFGRKRVTMAASTNGSTNDTKRKKIVLIGGGHAHVQVIKALCKSNRPSNVDVTVIDRVSDATYSGMVPGCVSNLYDVEDTLIRLRPLCEWARTEFIYDIVVDIDIDARVITLKDGDVLGYDVCSLDIGSTIRPIPGDDDANVIPTRPISHLIDRIQDAEIKKTNDKEDIHVAVVGGGAAGIELAMGIRGRWGQSDTNTNDRRVRVTILDSNNVLFPHESISNRNAVEKVLKDRGVTVRPCSIVTRVTPHELHLQNNVDRNSDDILLPYTHCVWATGAYPHPLSRVLADRGVGCDERGWIQVSSTLQSVTHPSLFAAGDCASIQIDCNNEDTSSGTTTTIPKAGVYAVRAGPILVTNLVNYILQQEESLQKPTGNTATENNSNNTRYPALLKYKPQDDFLKLIMCGDGTALGFRFGISLYGKWVWHLKDHIDRMFMNLFRAENLPVVNDELQQLDRNKDGNGSKHANVQYDDASKLQQAPPIAATEAALLLKRTDDNVNYEDAWKVLRDMMADDNYRICVLDEISN
mmetsp:Transcript_51091/g.59684  ORF Transcript_51091/g.59684 Transcript_51091/m.59684 type:complete len:591 (-) Transcript_51091:25-1797(-)